jgi:hypothetical protein
MIHLQANLRRIHGPIAPDGGEPGALLSFSEPTISFSRRMTRLVIIHSNMYLVAYRKTLFEASPQKATAIRVTFSPLEKVSFLRRSGSKRTFYKGEKVTYG